MFLAWSSSTPSLAGRRAWSSGMARKAISRNANHAGVAGVAAALLEPDDGYPLGSLAIAGPDHRLPDKAVEQLAGPLIAAARELAPQLAAVRGPHASVRQDALDVIIQNSSARDRGAGPRRSMPVSLRREALKKARRRP
jgi:hypothetical protein